MNGSNAREMPRLWTSAEVADYLGMSESWVRKRSADGTLPCVRFGASVRFDPDAIAAFARGDKSASGQVIALPRKTNRSR